MVALFPSRLSKELADLVQQECSPKEIIGFPINLNKQLLQAVPSEGPINHTDFIYPMYLIHVFLVYKHAYALMFSVPTSCTIPISDCLVYDHSFDPTISQGSWVSLRAFVMFAMLSRSLCRVFWLTSKSKSHTGCKFYRSFPLSDVNYRCALPFLGKKLSVDVCTYYVTLSSSRKVLVYDYIDLSALEWIRAAGCAYLLSVISSWGRKFWNVSSYTHDLHHRFFSLHRRVIPLTKCLETAGYKSYIEPRDKQKTFM